MAAWQLSYKVPVTEIMSARNVTVTPIINSYMAVKFP
jgi:hypothetical protein